MPKKEDEIYLATTKKGGKKRRRRERRNGARRRKSIKLNDSILCTYYVWGMKSLVLKKELRLHSCLPCVYITLGKNEAKSRNT